MSSSARTFRALYKTKEWKLLRLDQLSSEPCCKFCEQLGRVALAEVVDHITPHRGDESLFFDPKNLQSLCKQCHDSIKQRMERSGHMIGGDAYGNPTDPNHHWNS